MCTHTHTGFGELQELRKCVNNPEGRDWNAVELYWKNSKKQHDVGGTLGTDASIWLLNSEVEGKGPSALLGLYEKVEEGEKLIEMLAIEISGRI